MTGEVGVVVGVVFWPSSGGSVHTGEGRPEGIHSCAQVLPLARSARLLTRNPAQALPLVFGERHHPRYLHRY